MTDKNLKNDIVKWATHIGRKAAMKRLMVDVDLSPSMAERLVKGIYESNPHVDTVAKIRVELSKDGFQRVSRGKAS